MGSNDHPLNHAQQTALFEEALSVSNLLRDAVNAMHSLREPSQHQDAVFTMASIGAEKLLKLSIGAHSLDVDGTWPSIRTMKTFGHNLVELQDSALKIVSERGARTEYVKELIEFLTSSQTLTTLLAALSHYGQGGRFYNLDILGSGEKDPNFLSPTKYWELIESAALDEFPTLRTAAEFDLESGIPLLSAKISLLFDKWWFAYHHILMNNGFGKYGKSVGATVIPWEKSDPFKTGN